MARRCRPASPDGQVPGWRLRGLRDPGHQARQAVRRVRVVTAMPGATGPRPVTVRPQDAPTRTMKIVEASQPVQSQLEVGSA